MFSTEQQMSDEMPSTSLESTGIDGAEHFPQNLLIENSCRPGTSGLSNLGTDISIGKLILHVIISILLISY